jgi:recombination protein RecA
VKSAVAELPKKSNDDAGPRFRTGCLLLDLVVGGGPGRLGFPSGKVVNVVGDKSTGKTFLAVEIVACNFYRYGESKFRWNLDDAENGYTFDTKELYGVEVSSEKDTMRSKLVEEFDVNVSRFLKRLKAGERGIYVLDSLDGISNAELLERSEARLKAAESGKEDKEKGTYGVKTPKFLSQEFFKTQTGKFAEKDAMLLILSQTRDNIDPFSFKKYTRSGGRALDFYAHTVIYLAVVTKIKVKDRVVGIVVKAKTEKSKTKRPFRECTFLVYFDYGIDDIGTSLDFLFDLRGKDGKLVKAAEKIEWDGKEYRRQALILEIENSKAYKQALDRQVIERWEELENAVASNRRPKYA